MSAQFVEQQSICDRLVEEKNAGQFNRSKWNWCVDRNPTWDPETQKFVQRTTIYIMGQGAEQCMESFPLSGFHSPERMEQAREMIRQAFGVDRILNGVG